jgi:Ferritin-like
VDPPVASKAELVSLLRQAAELEHGLCCQYLYAAFTLKAGGDPGLTASQAALTAQWRQQITRVAVQEMYHLLLANDMLIALDAAPHFWRPNFPEPKSHYSQIGLPSVLAPFGLPTAQRFMCWEKPEEHGWWDKYCRKVSAAETARLAAFADAEDAAPRYRTIGQLYAIVEASFQTHPEWIDPAQASRQVTTEYVPFSPKVDPITTATDASRYVEIIVEEGEGTPDWDSNSHFAYYHQIVNQLDPSVSPDPLTFAASWPTVENPVYRVADAPPGSSLIEDPTAVAVGLLFDDLYLLMLQTLIRLFEPGGETPAQRRALANAALALMPLGIKPLGILLTRIPAGANYPDQYAGPSFELPPAIESVEGDAAAAAGALGERMRELATRARIIGLTNAIPPQLQYSYDETVARLETLVPLFDGLVATPA